MTWSRVREQAAEVGQSRAAYLPTLRYSGALDRLGRTSVAPGIAVIGEEGVSQGITRKLNGQTSESLLSFDWVLFDFGVRKANRRYARRLLEGAAAAHQSEVQRIFLDTVRGYYELRAAIGLVDARNRSLEVANRIFEAATAIHAAGVGSLADQLEAQTASDRALLDVADSEQRLRIAEGAFAVRLGFSPETPMQLSSETLDPATATPLLSEGLKGLLQQAAAKHPKIMEARTNIGAAQAEVAAQRARGRPVISLRSSFRRSDTPGSVAERQIFTDRVVGLQLEVPIFEGFSRRYQVRQAQARVERRRAELRLAEQGVSTEVWSSYQLFTLEAKRVELASRVMASARKQFEIAQARFKAGNVDIAQLLRARNEMGTAEQERVRARSQWQIAGYRLVASLAALDGSLLR